METVSKNPRRGRGRPKAFSSEFMKFVKMAGHSHLCSQRQLTNVAYAWHAMFALRNRRFSWLIDWPRADRHEPRSMKLMVLSELGRFGDRRLIRRWAEMLCEDKPMPVHKAVAMLRTGRRMLKDAVAEAGV